MAFAHTFLILLFTFFAIVAARQHHQQLKLIRAGSSLLPSKQPSSWQSSSGRFQFGFYKQNTGFAVGIWLVTSSDITIVWTAYRDDHPLSANATLTLTKGGLVLRTGEGNEKLITDTSEPAFSAAMLDSGNFVLYSKSFDIIWSSFHYPTDTILGGQNLTSGEELYSSVTETNSKTGRFRLKFVGKIVFYPTNTLDESRESYWTSDTSNFDGSYAVMNLSPTGVLQLMSSNGSLRVLAKSNSSFEKNMNESVIHRATLDSDGILRLYSHHFNTNYNDSNVIIEWSALQNQCQVNGFCGVNSFCSTSTNGSSKGDCHCFPGFDFINPDIRFLGCYKNFSDKEGCRRKEPSEFYNITNLENTKLGGCPYARLSSNSKEDCSNSCLNDCYCAAAFYFQKDCNKLKLPLLYGVNDKNLSATVFVKWSSGHTNLSNTRVHPAVPNERVVDDNKEKLVAVLAACLSSITFLCSLVAFSSFLVYKLRVKKYQKLRGDSNIGEKQEFTLQSFSYNELEQATDMFQEVLGRGCFGAVYKGSLCQSNKIVAVKRLENPTEEGERKFQAEMAAVRRTHHRNLVRLLGFCVQSSKKLLVYEFMSKGSLENLLFNGETRPLWRERMRIALDVARGILYLHEECEVQIIHCDIKLRNILIDDSWTAKISDFGLAKLLMPNQTGIVAEVKGSRGYMAPERQRSGLITVKSDVYSFGIVLLEIVCCRSNFEVNVSTADEVLLLTWVYNCFVAGELNMLVGVDEEVDMKTLERMVKVGLLCIQDDPSLRPSMKNVVWMLEGIMDIPVPPFPTPSLVIS